MHMQALLQVSRHPTVRDTRQQAAHICAMHTSTELQIYRSNRLYLYVILSADQG